MNRKLSISLKDVKKSCRAAAVGDYLWEDALKDVTLWLEADRGLSLHSHKGKAYSIGLNYNHDLSASGAYNKSPNLRDPREKSSKKTSVGETKTGQQYLSNQEILKTDYYNEILIKTDAMDSLHTVLMDTPILGRHAISLHRSFKNDYFQSHDIEKMQLILPDLVGAFSYSAKITGLLGSKDLRDSFGGLLNECLRIHSLSGDIGQILKGCEALRYDGNFLRPKSKALSTFFNLGFRRAIDGHTSRCQVKIDSPNFTGLHPVINISVSPRPKLIDWLPSDDPVVLLHVTKDQEETAGDIDIFAAIFDLTSAEKNMLFEILHAGSLKDAALSASVTYETARWHLKNIYLKTGYSKQETLLRAVREMDLSNAN